MFDFLNVDVHRPTISLSGYCNFPPELLIDFGSRVDPANHMPAISESGRFFFSTTGIFSYLQFPLVVARTFLECHWDWVQDQSWHVALAALRLQR